MMAGIGTRHDSADHNSSQPDRRPGVLWLIKGLGPGGAERLLVNHARSGDHARFRYEAAYLVPWKDQLVADLEAHGVQVTPLDRPREWDLRWAIEVRRLITAHRIDVVHAHSPYVAAVIRLVLRTLPRRRRPLVIYTEHNRWPRHRPVTRWANALTYPLNDHTIAVSDEIRDTIPRRYRSRVEVVVHGVDLNQVREGRTHRTAMRRELGIAPDAVVVGIVANFRPEKAQHDLLDAAAIALPADDRLVFVSVGQGPLEDDIRAQHRRLGLGDRFKILGYRNDPLAVMAAFDIFTLTSRHEGLPVALMEALVQGIPVVATTAGGIPQAVTPGSEGLLVAPGDVEGLAAAYLRLATNEDERGAMAAAALARGADFDIARAVRTLEDLYAGNAG